MKIGYYPQSIGSSSRAAKFTSISALIIVLACLPGVSGCRKGSSGASDDQSPVIVEIDGNPERTAAFERFVKARLSDFSLSQLDIDQQRSSLLDKFIERQVIVRQALERNIAPTDEEIRRTLEEQYKQTSTEGADQSTTALSGADRRIEIVNDLLALKFYQNEAPGDLKVSPEEIESHYAAHRDEYQGKNGFYVREIRVFEEAEAVRLQRQAVSRPDDFAVLAREYSDAPTAARGGLIYYEVDQLPPTLEQAITPLKVGSISRVVRSNFGYHIFKLEQRAEPLPLEKVKQEIEARLLSEKKQTLIDQFSERTVAAAKVVVHKGRLGFAYRGRFPTK